MPGAGLLVQPAHTRQACNDLGQNVRAATFSVYTKSTTANFTFVPTGYSYAGELQCRNEKDPTKLAEEGDFKLKLTNGTNLYGIYKQGGNQAETEGLSWALSNLNMTAPPTSFESAMPGLNASVYGYTKCAGTRRAFACSRCFAMRCDRNLSITHSRQCSRVLDFVRLQPTIRISTCIQSS